MFVLALTDQLAEGHGHAMRTVRETLPRITDHTGGRTIQESPQSGADRQFFTAAEWAAAQWRMRRFVTL